MIQFFYTERAIFVYSLHFISLIKPCTTVAHIIHRAHLVPFLHSVLRCIHLAHTDELITSKV